MIVKLTSASPVARILRILKDLPEEERMDVLATVCAAFVQTNGTISNEAKRSSRETVLGPLRRKPTCLSVWIEGRKSWRCSLPAGHSTSEPHFDGDEMRWRYDGDPPGNYALIQNRSDRAVRAKLSKARAAGKIGAK